MGSRLAVLVLLVLACSVRLALAQTEGAAPAQSPSDGSRRTPDEMGGMDMDAMADMDMPTSQAMTGIFGGYPMSRDASGTSWQPDLAEHQGLHGMAGDWMFMEHLMLWGIYDSQSGPRGGNKLFPAGMIMGSARRDYADSDTINFRAMLSPEPAMGANGYPLLLQTGETANGVTPLVDRQHPHNLFVELSGAYDHRLPNNNSILFYAGYPGEPALGPPAFMHRASGMDIPDAPITHHWMDSTHITFGVLTAGFVHDDWKLEVSQFTGREPDQDRYDFDSARLDSTSARVSWNPNQNWSLQTSWGHLQSPEQLTPTINENRYTASAMYVMRFTDSSSLAATLGWGLKSLSDGSNLNGLLLEGEYKPAELWTLFARGEWEENNELVADGVVVHAAELTLGAIHDWKVVEHWKFGVGALYAFDFVPSVSPSYGSDPHGMMAFIRVAAD